MTKILERSARKHALAVADSPGGGMILPNCKYYEFQKLTEAELEELYTQDWTAANQNRER